MVTGIFGDLIGETSSRRRELDCQVVCAWCGRRMGVKHFETPASDRRERTASHSICHTCLRKLLRQAMRVTLPASTASR